jgi:poly(A) polymerase
MNGDHKNGDAMKVSGDWLTGPGTQAVLGMLTRAGYRALVVGGCVRNALLGVPVTDVDIATNALPATVLHMAPAAGLKAVPTGYAHGTVTIVAEGTGYEVTSFRDDVETFGRHARVAYATDLARDAARRDFTMNALYARADGTVVDPLGGLADLQARNVRFVGDPHERIREDCLRILRFFRFHAQYGDARRGLDPAALAACAAHVVMLAGLSRERIGAEMRKLLGAPDPAPALCAMEEIGVLAAILPGTKARPMARLVALEGRAHGGWLRRLATLGGPDPSQSLRCRGPRRATLPACARRCTTTSPRRRWGTGWAASWVPMPSSPAPPCAIPTCPRAGTPISRAARRRASRCGPPI